MFASWVKLFRILGVCWFYTTSMFISIVAAQVISFISSPRVLQALCVRNEALSRSKKYIICLAGFYLNVGRVHWANGLDVGICQRNKVARGVKVTTNCDSSEYMHNLGDVKRASV